MNLRNDIQTKAIEVNIQSSGIAEKEQINHHPDDEKTHWEQKDNIKNQAQTKTHNEPVNEITELQTFHKSTAGTMNYREGLEQINDLVRRNLRAKIEGELFDESALTQDNLYQHYLQKIRRIELSQDILSQKYYNDFGQISHYQILLPKQRLEKFLQALHGYNANHPGITKMIEEAQ